MVVNHPDAWVEGVALQDGLNMNGANLYMDVRGGTVSNCVLRGGYAEWNTGSAAYLNSEKALLTHCVVTNNTLNNHNTHPNSVLVIQHGLVENCLIAENRMIGNTGVNLTSAMVELLNPGTGKMRNCTFAGNDVSHRGILHSEVPNDPSRIMYCVFAGNMDVHGGKPTLTHQNCVSESSLDDVYELDGFTNCRYAEPGVMFKNFAKGDYRLGPASPAINAGRPLSPQQIAEAGVDLDGKPRVVGTRMDHGCYESPVRGTLFLIR
jgi:hypothetical protein